MTGPLDGIVVVDASWGMPSAIATMLMADYGATVIKVERPGEVAPGQQVLRSILDRGKRSVALDLGTAAGQQRLDELLGRADVFVENGGPGRADELGHGYERVHAAHPELVYLSLTGYGTNTPWADEPGYEALLNARMGMTAEQRGHRDGPIFLGHPTVSYGTAFISVIGVLSALRARSLGAGGQRVDTSLLDGMLTLASMNWWWNERDISYLARSGKQTGFGRSRLITDPFQCADGEWLVPHTGGPGSFKRMMDVLGFGDRIQSVEGPEMKVPLDDDEYEVARNLVPEAFRSRPRDEWVALFAENDIACLPMLRPEEVFDQPQVQHAGIVVDIEDALVGPTRQIGPVLKFAGTPAPSPNRAPLVGEHDEAPLPERAERVHRTPDVPLERPLEGVKIVDFSSYFATGFASRLLADLGADVIKVEPLVGDQMRPLGDLWEASQRGKRGISVDLRTPEGQEIARRLVAEADVVTVNFRPGKAEKVGLGYEQVKALNPEVVYLYLPGFGASGPMADLKSFAPLQSGYVGLNFEGSGAGNAPIRRVMGNEDQYNGFLGAVAILMGVLSKDATGKGQYVESPQLHSSLFVRTELAVRPDGEPLESHVLDAGQNGFGPTYRLYRTADGWIMVAAFGERAFSGLCTALGRADLVTDARFAEPAARHRAADELAAELATAFAAQTSEQARAALAAAGVPAEVPQDAPFISDFFWEEWASETGRVVEHHHPEYGWSREVGMTIHLSKTPGRFVGPSPRLGEHTRAVLAELGYDAQQVETLMESVCTEPAAVSAGSVD